MDYRLEQEVVALIKLEDEQQDFLELDVLENGVILGESIMFEKGKLRMLGIGTMDGQEWFDHGDIKEIPEDFFEDFRLFVYFARSSEALPVPWEAQTLKYRVTGVEEGVDVDRFTKDNK